jgi:hypothetical protein
MWSRRYDSSIGLVATLLATLGIACLGYLLMRRAFLIEPTLHVHDTYYVGLDGFVGMAGFNLVTLIGLTLIARHDHLWNAFLTISWSCGVAYVVVAISLWLGLSQRPLEVSGWRFELGMRALFALTHLHAAFITLAGLVVATWFTVRNSWRVRRANGHMTPIGADGG